MSELHPTKTRLALLAAVDVGHVTYWPGSMGDPAESRDHNPTTGWRRVTTRVEELRRSGWVRMGKPTSDHWNATRKWEITDAGRAVLEAHR